MKILKFFAIMFAILLVNTSSLFGQDPKAKEITPISGFPGQIVTITGKNLADVTAVNFGSIKVKVDPANRTNHSIEVQLPLSEEELTPQTVPISLAVRNQVFETNLQFVIKGNWTVLTTNLTGNSLSSFPVVETLPTTATTVSDASGNVATPLGIAIHPDGTTAYSVNSCVGCNQVVVTDIATNSVVNQVSLNGTAGNLRDIAINSVGTLAYVTSQADGRVYVLNIAGNRKQNPQNASNFPSTNPADVGSNPTALAIDSNDQTLYVVNQGSSPSSLTSFDLVQDPLAPLALPSELLPPGGSYNTLALTPLVPSLPPRLYISDSSLGSITILSYSRVSRLAPSDQQVIVVAGVPAGMVVSIPGDRLFVADLDRIHVVSTLSNTLIFEIIVPGAVDLFDIVVSPDNSTLFVTDRTQNRVYSVPNPPTNVAPVGPFSFVTVGSAPSGIAITPDQAPLSGFEVLTSPQVVGQPITFSAAGLSDSPVGTIANYCWDFDDGSPVVCTTDPTITHTYSETGNFAVMLTVTNTAGTSTEIIFPTGQEITNNGGSTAISTRRATVQAAVSDLVCPPVDVEGCRDITSRGKRNIITWEAPQRRCGIERPVAYRIFLDADLTELLATIPASRNEQSFRFVDSTPGRGRKKYFIVSVDEFGNQSLAVKVTVGGRQRLGRGCCGF